MTLAVVTGAGRGIGRATALALGRRGYDVVLAGLSHAHLEEVAQEMHSFGRKAWTLACDVGKSTQVEELRTRVLALGTPEVLVHSAGIVKRAPTEEVTDADWDAVMGANLRGPFLVTRAFLAPMKAQGRGRIVFVASISSVLGTPGIASYCASKWGVLGFAKALTEETRDTGVFVASILPGSVDTDMLKGSGFAPKMTAEEVARSIEFLALDAPPAMHGTALEMFG